MRLGGALLFAWALPFGTGVGVGTPWSFAFHAIRGDLGVSPTSGIDVDARVRVFAVGSVALAALAVVVAATVPWIMVRLDRRNSGRAGITAVVALCLFVGSVERWRLPNQSGARLGDATIERLVALGVPAVVLGGALAFVATRRDGDRRLGSLLRRDAETIVIGVLVCEVAFDRPGLGVLLRDAVQRHDVALIRGVVLVVGAAVAVLGAIRPAPDASRPLTAPRALWCAGVVAAVAVVGLVVSDAIGLANPAAVRPASNPPGSDPIFGVDAVGHDNLARLVATARVSLAIATVAAAALLTLAMIVGLAVGSANGEFGRRSRAGLALRLPMVLIVAAVLAVRERSAAGVAVALSTMAILPLAAVIADGCDRAWRLRETRPLAEVLPMVIGIGVSAIGTAFVAEVTLGIFGIVVDGRTTLGREVANQLPWATTTPWPVMLAAAVTATIGWSITALGYGVAASVPSSETTSAQSLGDGRPHPRP